MAIDTTVGGANANSWASVAEYKAFWASRYFNTAQLAATDATIEQLLEWSCLIMSAAFRWTGAAVDAVQALPWPRSGMLSPNGFVIPTTENPKRLKDAQCQFAGILLSGDRTTDNES